MKDMKELFSKNITKLNVKTSSFLTINKLQTYISSLEKEIDDKKWEMADRIVTQWKENQTIPEELIRSIIAEIEEKEVLIEEQKREIAAVEENQNRILGVSHTETASPEGVETTGNEAAVKEVIYCSSCGTANPKTGNFCRNCGSPLGK